MNTQGVRSTLLRYAFRLRGRKSKSASSVTTEPLSSAFSMDEDETTTEQSYESPRHSWFRRGSSKPEVVDKTKHVHWDDLKTIQECAKPDSSSSSEEEDDYSPWLSRKDLRTSRYNELVLLESVPEVMTYLNECRQVYTRMEEDSLQNEQLLSLQSYRTDVLIEGRREYPGMERSRIPWRVLRTRKIIRNILKVHNEGMVGEELAKHCSQLTQIEETWAHFVAQLDHMDIAEDEDKEEEQQ